MNTASSSFVEEPSSSSKGLSKTAKYRPYLEGLSATTKARFIADLDEKVRIVFFIFSLFALL